MTRMQRLAFRGLIASALMMCALISTVTILQMGFTWYRLLFGPFAFYAAWRGGYAVLKAPLSTPSQEHRE